MKIDFLNRSRLRKREGTTKFVEWVEPSALDWEAVFSMPWSQRRVFAGCVESEHLLAMLRTMKEQDNRLQLRGFNPRNQYHLNYFLQVHSGGRYRIARAQGVLSLKVRKRVR